ncbi:hypothetical protein ZIOFF_075902 [Zingiber officinale]|uniref:Uncharacterized protein n=1 Tax=Zingiber officinale TaxID=94328 RepID=A0A8J5CPR8_ZINOF|nr:hypothetical protein ZIOFF_075902 [Zingiber officinale]
MGLSRFLLDVNAMRQRLCSRAGEMQQCRVFAARGEIATRNESALLLLSPLLHPGRGCEGLRASQISMATPLLACARSHFAKTSSLLAGLIPLLEGVVIDMESKEMCTKANVRYDCLLFDLDDTLYPLSSRIVDECRKNILGALAVMRNFLLVFQAIGHNFDYDDFHSFVHGRLPYETLKPDPVISQLLLSLPVRKVIFTNGDQAHAAKVLKKLDLEDCFATVICFETLNPPSSSSREDNSTNIFDIIGYLSEPDPNVDLPKTSILCKPSMFLGLQTLIPREL